MLIAQPMLIDIPEGVTDWTITLRKDCVGSVSLQFPDGQTEVHLLEWVDDTRQMRVGELREKQWYEVDLGNGVRMCDWQWKDEAETVGCEE